MACPSKVSVGKDMHTIGVRLAEFEARIVSDKLVRTTKAKPPKCGAHVDLSCPSTDLERPALEKVPGFDGLWGCSPRKPKTLISHKVLKESYGQTTSNL